jgi:CRP/FNR family transcriptional regulator, anaerobic regulatory protein
LTEAIQAYLTSYKNICSDLTQEELDFIEMSVSVSELKRNSFYLQSDHVQKEMGFVFKGVLRSYCIDPDGNEKTISFIPETTYAADYSAFITQKPSRFFIQCLEPCIIVNFPHSAMQEAYSKHKNFERYGRLIAESILVKRQNRIESFLFENAEQRYLSFITQNPDLINRISLTHLSSYLGIERQSLSRIRNKLTQK